MKSTGRMRIGMAAYLLTLAALLVGAFIPTGHFWGIRVWAHFGPALPPVLFAIGLVAGLVIWRATRSIPNETADSASPER